MSRPTEDFLNECIARALFTLPWASVDDTDLTLREIHAVIKVDHREPIRERALGMLREMIEREIGIHVECGNVIKAGVLHQFLVDILAYYAPPTPKKKRGQN